MVSQWISIFALFLSSLICLDNAYAGPNSGYQCREAEIGAGNHGLIAAHLFSSFVLITGKTHIERHVISISDMFNEFKFTEITYVNLKDKIR